MKRGLEELVTEEEPAFFSAGNETLFGILTRPNAESSEIAVVMLPGGAGTRLSSNRNRLSVRVCQRVSHLGYHAFRFDFHGAGESTGAEEFLRLDQPFVEDVEGAIRWLQEQGVTGFVLIGSCFGARTALASASRLSGVRGVVLISPPVRDYGEGERIVTRMADDWSIWRYLGRALRLRVLVGFLSRDRRRIYGKAARLKWRSLQRRLSPASPDDGAGVASANFTEPLVDLLGRGIPVLILYGDAEDSYEEFQRARRGRLGALLESAEATVSTLPGAVHGFTTVAVQDEVLDVLAGWLADKRDRLIGG